MASCGCQCQKEIAELKDFIKRWFMLVNRRFDDQDKNFSDQNKKLNEIHSYVCQQFETADKPVFSSSTDIDVIKKICTPVSVGNFSMVSQEQTDCNVPSTRNSVTTSARLGRAEIAEPVVNPVEVNTKQIEDDYVEIVGHNLPSFVVQTSDACHEQPMVIPLMLAKDVCINHGNKSFEANQIGLKKGVTVSSSAYPRRVEAPNRSVISAVRSMSSSLVNKQIMKKRALTANRSLVTKISTTKSKPKAFSIDSSMLSTSCSVQSSQQFKKKRWYTPDEDNKLLLFLLKQMEHKTSLVETPHSEILWKLAFDLKVLGPNRTVLSMQNRFHKCIVEKFFAIKSNRSLQYESGHKMDVEMNNTF